MTSNYRALFFRFRLIFSRVGMIACLLLPFGVKLPAEFAIEWEWRNPLPQGNILWSAIRVEETVLAVGWNGTILLRESGAFETQDSGTSAYLHDILWDGDRYIVVGGFPGAILTSDDGRTWTQRVSDAPYSLNGIAWDNEGLYVAVGDNGTVLTSNDTVEWTPQESGTTTRLKDILWKEDGENSEFVVVGGIPVVSAGWPFGGGGRIQPERVVATSPDGVSWEATETKSVAGFRSVAWNGEHFVATDIGGVFRSSDAADWEQVIYSAPGTTFPTFRSVTWNGESFLAVGSHNVIYSSEDGFEWESSSLGLENPTRLNAIRYDGSGYVLAGDHGLLAVAEDPGEWTDLTQGRRNTLRDIAFLNNRYVAVGDQGTILSSDDGRQWEPLSSGVWAGLQAVTAGDDQWVAVGGSGSVTISEDGLTFSPVDTGNSAHFQGIAWNGEIYVLVGFSGTNSGVIKTSPNGQDWTDRTPETIPRLNDVAWNGSLFVAVGASGTILTSADGKTWEEPEIDHASWLYGIASDGHLFVAVGSGRNALVSSDGVNWETFDTGAGTGYPSATVHYACLWDGRRFIAAGFNGHVVTSADGTKWEYVGSPTNQPLYALASTGDDIVAVGDGGTILEGILPGEEIRFDDWVAAHFNEGELGDDERTDPDADPGGYGIPNLLRYAFDLDPRQPAATGMPSVATRVPEGQSDLFLTIEFTRRRDAADLEYQVWAGDDLAEWQLLGEDYLFETVVGDGLERITYRDKDPIHEAVQRFMRVTVNLVR